MYSRRTFLIGLLLFSQLNLLASAYNSIYSSSSRKFIKRGWVLQGGDI
jgi:hypothetical protein